MRYDFVVSFVCTFDSFWVYLSWGTAAACCGSVYTDYLCSLTVLKLATPLSPVVHRENSALTKDKQHSFQTVTAFS